MVEIGSQKYKLLRKKSTFILSFNKIWFKFSCELMAL